ncbi:hypothetical protein [Mycobacterium lepromatosis]|uniref:hypothetical protein n=1 Tax=Mycobacterium lepromatosis TaxID=480418 RepID=UPI0009E54F20|nr:hypothetical protein [Mycobacterium lepromatosis]
MTVVDAQFYWMSTKVSNDQFRVYAFDVQPIRFNCFIDKASRCARSCPDLAMRVDDGPALTYPQWGSAVVKPAYLLKHKLTDHSWHGCLAAVFSLASESS